MAGGKPRPNARSRRKSHAPSQEAASRWRSRIVDHGTEPPGKLVENPQNWRLHSQAQQDALETLLDTVGWVQDVVVNRQTGNLIDGHLRVRAAVSAGEPSIPVVYVDLDPAEEALVLASLDPLAGMATTDQKAVVALLSQVKIPDGSLADLLGGLTGSKTEVKFMATEPQSEYHVVVECADEHEQKELIDRLKEEGLTCRAA